MKKSEFKKLIKEVISEVISEQNKTNNLPPKEVLDFLIKLYIRDTGSDLDSASRYIKSMLKEVYFELKSTLGQNHEAATFTDITSLGIATPEDRTMFFKVLKKSYPKPNNIVKSDPSEFQRDSYVNSVTVTFPPQEAISEIMHSKPKAPEKLIQLIINRLSVKTAKPQNSLWHKIENYLNTSGKWLKSHNSSGDYEYNTTTTKWVIPMEAFYDMVYKGVENFLNNGEEGDDSDFSRDDDNGEVIAGTSYSNAGKYKVVPLGNNFEITYTRSGGMDI